MALALIPCCQLAVGQGFELEARAQALAAEVVALEEKSLAVRVRELRLTKEVARAGGSLQHMQRQLENLTRDRGDLVARLSTMQVCARRGCFG